MFKKVLLILLLNTLLFANNQGYSLYGLIKLPSNISHSEDKIGLELYSGDDINFSSAIREINASSIDTKNSIYSYSFEELENGSYYIVLPIKDNDGLKDLNESGVYVKKFNLVTGNQREDGTYRVYYNDFKDIVYDWDFPYGGEKPLIKKSNCRYEYHEVFVTVTMDTGESYQYIETKPKEVCDSKIIYINEIVPIDINKTHREINFKFFESKPMNITINIDDSNLTNMDTKEFNPMISLNLHSEFFYDINSNQYNKEDINGSFFFGDEIGLGSKFNLIDDNSTEIYRISFYEKLFFLKDINFTNKFKLNFTYPNDENIYEVNLFLTIDEFENENYIYDTDFFKHLIIKENMLSFEINETLLQVDLNVSNISTYKNITIHNSESSSTTNFYIKSQENNNSKFNISLPLFKGDNYFFDIHNHQNADVEIEKADTINYSDSTNRVFSLNNFFTYDGEKLVLVPYYSTLEDIKMKIDSNFNLFLPEMNITQEKVLIDTNSLNFNANIGESITKTFTITNNNNYGIKNYIIIDFENSKEFISHYSNRYNSDINNLNQYYSNLDVEFSVDKILCEMEANQSCEIKVTYTPIDEGVDEAFIIIRDSRLSASYLSTSTDKIITLTGNGIDEDFKEIELQIPKGWSLLAIPIDESVEFAKSESDNIWIYQNGWIQNPKTIEPYIGFWIYSNSDRVVDFKGKVYEPKFKYNDEIWELKGTGKSLKEIDYEYNFKEIWIYDSFFKKWIYNPKEIEAGRGFWLRVHNPLPSLPSL